MNTVKTSSFHASLHDSLHVTTNSSNRGERGAVFPGPREKLEETVLLYPAIITTPDGQGSNTQLTTLAEALDIIRQRAEEARHGTD